MKAHFIEIDHREKRSHGVWGVEGRMGWRVGVPNATQIRNCCVTLEHTESFPDAMKRCFPDRFGPSGACKVHQLKLGTGQYYPRIARPNSSHPFESPGTSPSGWFLTNDLALIRGRLVILMRYLQRIFQTIHPSPSNFEVYGDEVRNLLILACTEAEAQWRGILRANGIQPNRPTTLDYVKLVEPMRLNEYSVTLPFYPWLNPIGPFAKWSASGQPTQNLEWYDVYNQAKHDNVLNFSKSKLSYAVDAVAACAIMLCAQFGSPNAAFGHASELKYFFNLSDVPAWDPSEVYVNDGVGRLEEWSAVQYDL